MLPEDALRLARAELKKYELSGWTITLDSARRRCGFCRYSRKAISLGREYVRLNEEPDVWDTILHEIAHALVGPFHHHDEVWLAKAREIGCSGTRLADAKVKLPEYRYIGTCPTCKMEFHRDMRVPGAACKWCNRQGLAASIIWLRAGTGEVVAPRAPKQDALDLMAKYPHLMRINRDAPDGRTCTIKCVECGTFRNCKPQDVFQVKRCYACKSKRRSK